jgi:ElaB/YqjD/DUF883 family membrane-anchored ribosome-binding protein
MSDMAREAEKESDMEQERDSARGAASGRGQAQPRFSPSAVLDEVVARARDIGRGSSEFASNVGATVRDNPVPIVLLAAGVASLIASERMGKARSEAGAGGAHRDRDEDGGRTRTERVSRARSAAAELADRSRDTGALLNERMRSSLAQVRDTGARTFQDEPLLVAGLGLAVGAALGALLPLSQRERRTLGPTRERVLEHARQAVREGAERVRDGADRVREGAERVRGLTERAASSGRAANPASRRQETEDAETDERMES